MSEREPLPKTERGVIRGVIQLRSVVQPLIVIAWACYIFADDRSNKFWRIRQASRYVQTWWGRTGTVGQSKTKSLTTEKAAHDEWGRLLREKLGKGYVPAEPRPDIVYLAANGAPMAEQDRLTFGAQQPQRTESSVQARPFRSQPTAPEFGSRPSWMPRVFPAAPPATNGARLERDTNGRIAVYAQQNTYATNAGVRLLIHRRGDRQWLWPGDAREVVEAPGSLYGYQVPPVLNISGPMQAVTTAMEAATQASGRLSATMQGLTEAHGRAARAENDRLREIFAAQLANPSPMLGVITMSPVDSGRMRSSFASRREPGERRPFNVILGRATAIENVPWMVFRNGTIHWAIRVSGRYLQVRDENAGHSDVRYYDRAENALSDGQELVQARRDAGFLPLESWQATSGELDWPAMTEGAREFAAEEEKRQAAHREELAREDQERLAAARVNFKRQQEFAELSRRSLAELNIFRDLEQGDLDKE